MATDNVFRVFVSSTFSDFEKEREALNDKVFKPLRDLCARHNAQFQAIDLRWGISDQATRTQQTVQICLAEVERCKQTTRRPNFIALIGDRYGWCPAPYQIPQSEFLMILDQTTKVEDRDLLQEWYQLDKNAIPATFMLRPRIGIFTEGRMWTEVERRLHDIIETSTESFPSEQRRKYTASATKLEILQGIFDAPNAEESAFCFSRIITPLPHGTAAKIYSDVLNDTDFAINTVAQTRLKELKDRLRNYLPNNWYEYEARWEHDSLTGEHISRLCEDVLKCLKTAILAELDTRNRHSSDPLEAEMAAQSGFAGQRLTHFIKRNEVNERIQSYIAQPINYPLVLSGDSGSGKTTVMANIVQQEKDSPGILVSRFIGATPGSSDLSLLLGSVCQQIARYYQVDIRIGVEYSDLTTTFKALLANATFARPILLVFDALDQLSVQQDRDLLAWFPTQLPAHVHMICSLLPGDLLNALRKQLNPSCFVQVGVMPVEDGLSLLKAWLADANRTLQPEQENYVIQQFSTNGNPFYLRLASEEAKLWRSHTTAQPLSPTIPGLIRDNLFRRLADDSNHGEILVAHTLALLVAARNGLSETEMLDVLAQDEVYWNHLESTAYHALAERQIPMVIWSRLYFDLRAYLKEQTSAESLLLTFYHRQLQETAESCYLSESNALHFHQLLSDYFAAQPLYRQQATAQVPNRRKLDELAYQQFHARQNEELYGLLTESPKWMEAHFEAAGRYTPYLDDIDRGLQTSPPPPVLIAMHMAKLLVQDRVNEIRDEEIKTLIARNQVDKAIDLVRGRAVPRSRADGMILIYCEHPNDNTLTFAEQAVLSIPDGDEKTNKMQTLVAEVRKNDPVATQRLLNKTIILAQSMSKALERLNKLLDLNQQVGPVLDELLSAAAVVSLDKRPEVLARIGLRLFQEADPRASSVLDQAVDIVAAPQLGKGQQEAYSKELLVCLFQADYPQTQMVLELALEASANNWWYKRELAQAFAKAGFSHAARLSTLQIQHVSERFDLLSELGFCDEAVAILPQVAMPFLPEKLQRSLSRLASNLIKIGKFEEAVKLADYITTESRPSYLTQVLQETVKAGYRQEIMVLLSRMNLWNLLDAETLNELLGATDAKALVMILDKIASGWAKLQWISDTLLDLSPGDERKPILLSSGAKTGLEVVTNELVGVKVDLYTERAIRHIVTVLTTSGLDHIREAEKIVWAIPDEQLRVSLLHNNVAIALFLEGEEDEAQALADKSGYRAYWRKWCLELINLDSMMEKLTALKEQLRTISPEKLDLFTKVVQALEHVIETFPWEQADIIKMSEVSAPTLMPTLDLNASADEIETLLRDFLTPVLSRTRGSTPQTLSALFNSDYDLRYVRTSDDGQPIVTSSHLDSQLWTLTRKQFIRALDTEWAGAALDDTLATSQILWGGDRGTALSDIFFLMASSKSDWPFQVLKELTNFACQPEHPGTDLTNIGTHYIHSVQFLVNLGQIYHKLADSRSKSAFQYALDVAQKSPLAIRGELLEQLRQVIPDIDLMPGFKEAAATVPREDSEVLPNLPVDILIRLAQAFSLVGDLRSQKILAQARQAAVEGNSPVDQAKLLVKVATALRQSGNPTASDSIEAAWYLMRDLPRFDKFQKLDPVRYSVIKTIFVEMISQENSHSDEVFEELRATAFTTPFDNLTDAFQGDSTRHYVFSEVNSLLDELLERNDDRWRLLVDDILLNKQFPISSNTCLTIARRREVTLALRLAQLMPKGIGQNMSALLMATYFLPGLLANMAQVGAILIILVIFAIILPFMLGALIIAKFSRRIRWIPRYLSFIRHARRAPQVFWATIIPFLLSIRQYTQTVRMMPIAELLPTILPIPDMIRFYWFLWIKKFDLANKVKKRKSRRGAFWGIAQQQLVKRLINEGESSILTEFVDAPQVGRLLTVTNTRCVLDAAYLNALKGSTVLAYLNTVLIWSTILQRTLPNEFLSMLLEGIRVAAWSPSGFRNFQNYILNEESGDSITHLQ